MNHLEALTAEWLNYKGYFIRTAVKVGKRAKGGWDGELDVVGFNVLSQHFLHVECSVDSKSWEFREGHFKRKFRAGYLHARALFEGMPLPAELDQVVVHGYASSPDKHRDIGGGRLVTSQELTAEIMAGIPNTTWKNAVPETHALLRTLQFAKMAGATVAAPLHRLIPHK
ncbi:MAG: hypothetical protein K2P94_10700 [Rhodospirillaceae bacterium]|nr:hypothetical protein [Rhodospirillaceae bacterium]